MYKGWSKIKFESQYWNKRSQYQDLEKSLSSGFETSVLF